MKIIFKIFVPVLLLIFCFCFPTQAAVLNLAGDFHPVLSINGQGEMYFKTSENDVSISIDDLDNNTHWKLFARCVMNSPFAEKLNCLIRRCSNGVGPGAVRGGWNNVSIKNSNTELFSGCGAIYDVKIQLEISEIHADFPEGPFNINLVFRLVTFK